MLIREKGIADQLDEIIYYMAPDGEQRKWPHLKMNPWGKTPTLALADGSYLSKTAGVVRYLDQKYPSRKITGESALEQGQDTM